MEASRPDRCKAKPFARKCGGFFRFAALELAQKSGETEKANGGDSRRKDFALQQAHPLGRFRMK
ncbi:hypothetical protein [Robiginitalea biformata]|uniref:Uncharacterized protein n=1 Tax=Robiginitalea biformata (strain ATCC BAA-864 / DSM 15991 / KCTC 12146 / HTCC2501) TaxID=313596 RepID=A4CGQ5_ROBBH|nr:hypothetical protein [Robiginitalea biformata]EAR16113.1 hypothetical protein RB2501_04425 [Robiginitalea biformata HTCC2501]